MISATTLLATQRTSDKSDKVRLAVSAIAGSMHVVQSVVFLVLGYPHLAILSLGAIVIFAFGAWMIVRGNPRLGGWIAYFEIFSHVTLMIFIWGPRANYWIYFVPLAGGPYLTSGVSERWGRVVGTTIPLIAAPLLFILCKDRAPMVAASDQTLTLLSVMNAAGALLGQVGINGWFARVAANAEAATEKAHERSEALLLNILPAPIAARLKDGEHTIADSFDNVSVLFADIVGFTTISARMSTRELIVLLNDVFSDFDALAEKHGLEKIKTIGDAYMVVGGLPTPRADHAEAIAKMALDMRDCIKKRHFGDHGSETLDVRIGIHSGSVVAGVIGTRKFTYDLWGDTVNVASRMESHGEPGRIQISDATHALLVTSCDLKERGIVHVKGRGDMHTWFLEGTKS